MILNGFDLSKQRFLIAEIGNNHEGDASLAKELVDSGVLVNCVSPPPPRLAPMP